MKTKRYVSVDVDTDETGEFCHEMCLHINPEFCSLWKHCFDDCFTEFPPHCWHKRLDICKEHEVNTNWNRLKGE